MSLAEVLDPFSACPVFEVLYSEGDRLPDVGGTLKNFDLTGFTIRMNLQRPSDVLEKDAIITDAANGIFEFDWLTTDLVKGFGQLAVIRIIDPSGESQTLARFQLDIHEVPTP